MVLEPLPDERFPPAVEAAAYFLIAEMATRGERLRVRAHRSDGRLLVEVDGAERPGVDLEDRIGALDGVLIMDGTTVRAEIPCGS
jgi:hypothetical protein